MNPSFRKCLENRKIFPSPAAKKLVIRELDTARADLTEAEKSFKRGGYKWSTIQSYYAMFHAARALLFHRGYRERSHFCLAVALDALYVETNLLPVKCSNAFKKAMSLRENGDYSSEFSEEGAKALIKNARELLAQAEKILG